MKRMHVHVAVDDLQKSISFYSALFAAEPSVNKPDYAKWMLDDPRVNFAISTRGKQPDLALALALDSPEVVAQAARVG
jgi:catechol 2,3-dioxygenase-like lactoylglutathione lyase family enzyme